MVINITPIYLQCHYQSKPLRGVNFKMVTNPKDAFKGFYPKLLEIIPISLYTFITYGHFDIQS